MNELSNPTASITITETVTEVPTNNPRQKAKQAPKTLPFVLPSLTLEKLSETVLALPSRIRTMAQTTYALAELTNAHAGETDSLSNILKEKSFELMKFVAGAQKGPIEQMIAGVDRHIKILEENLCGFLGNRRLKEPVLVNDLVWEKSQLAWYQKLLSKFELPTPAGKAHTFAIGMLKWINTLKSSQEWQRWERRHLVAPNPGRIQVTVNALGIPVINRPISLDALPQRPCPFSQMDLSQDVSDDFAIKALGIFAEAMETEIKRREALKLIAFLRKANSVLLKQIEKRDAQSDVDIKRAEAASKQRLAEAKKFMNEMHEEHKANLSAVYIQLQRADVRMENLSKELKESQMEAKELQQQLIALHNQIAALWGRVAQLQNDLDDADGCIIA